MVTTERAQSKSLLKIKYQPIEDACGAYFQILFSNDYALDWNFYLKKGDLEVNVK